MSYLKKVLISGTIISSLLLAGCGNLNIFSDESVSFSHKKVVSSALEELDEDVDYKVFKKEKEIQGSNFKKHYSYYMYLETDGYDNIPAVVSFEDDEDINPHLTVLVQDFLMENTIGVNRNYYDGYMITSDVFDRFYNSFDTQGSFNYIIDNEDKTLYDTYNELGIDGVDDAFQLNLIMDKKTVLKSEKITDFLDYVINRFDYYLISIEVDKNHVILVQSKNYDEEKEQNGELSIKEILTRDDVQLIKKEDKLGVLYGF